jgi:hypothetical protein
MIKCKCSWLIVVFVISSDTPFRTIGKVDATMNQVNEQMEHANEIAEALANPIMGPIMDDVSVFCWDFSYI